MCVKQLVDFISSKCDSDKQRSEFAQLLRDPAHHVGWLVNERFLNIPMEIAPPLLVSLRSVASGWACLKLLNLVSFLIVQL